MYIAIEGIKGVGKSSIINKLVRYFESQKEDFLFARYTMPTNSTIDKIVVRYPILMRNCDWFKEYVYACRLLHFFFSLD